MNTFPIIEPRTNRIVAFEIENIFISKSSAIKILEDSHSAINVRRGGRSAETIASFEAEGVACIVWEPFGDNSRYWIGPEEPEKNMVDMQHVEREFRRFEPPMIRWILGNILLFRIPTLFRRR